MSDSEEDDVVEFVIEPSLFKPEYTYLELVEIEAAHAAAASQCK